MFHGHDSDSDSDQENYEEYDGYIGAKEYKKKVKKAVIQSKINGPEETPDDQEFDETLAEEPEEKKKDNLQEDPDMVQEDDDFGPRFNPYSAYKKVIKYLDPSENMTSDKLSTFDYSSLVSLEIARADQEGYTFISPGDMNNTTDIAEATINSRMCPFLVVRKVGFQIDHDNKQIIEFCEVHNPNQMILPEMNATYKV